MTEAQCRTRAVKLSAHLPRARTGNAQHGTQLCIRLHTASSNARVSLSRRCRLVEDRHLAPQAVDAHPHPASDPPGRVAYVHHRDFERHLGTQARDRWHGPSGHPSRVPTADVPRLPSGRTRPSAGIQVPADSRCPTSPRFARRALQRGRDRRSCWSTRPHARRGLEGKPLCHLWRFAASTPPHFPAPLRGQLVPTGASAVLASRRGGTATSGARPRGRDGAAG